MGCEYGQFGFDGRHFLFALGIFARFLGLLQRFGGLGFIEIGAADRSIGKHGDHLRLDFEYTTGDKNEFLGTATRRLDAYFAGV